MGDSHQKLLDDCTVHPNFLYSSLYLHALIVRARFARYNIQCDLMPFFLQGFQYRPSHPLQDGTLPLEDTCIMAF